VTTINILIADKESSTIKLMSEVLGKFGHQVYTTETGTQALEIYNDVSIDIVVTGVDLSVINGYDLIQQIQADNSKKTCFFITSEFRDKIYDQE